MALIAIEGIDGAGCGTQASLLHEHLSDQHDTALHTYPDYEHPTGELLDRFLHGSFDLDTREQFLTYLANMVGDLDLLRAAKQDTTHVIVDRYVTSTLAYQEVNGLDRETMLSVIQDLGFPRADLVVLLDCPVDEAHRRKQDEKDELDRYEEDTGNQRQVAATYRELAEADVFSDSWRTVDASPSKDAVHEEIRSIIEQELGD